MAFIPTPNTVKACLKYIQNGQHTCNVFHFDVGHVPGEEDLRTVATMLTAWWIAEVAPLTNVGTVLEAVEVTDVSAPNQEGIVFTDGLPSGGTKAGNALPNNATVCIKCATGFIGRSRRGRKYFAGLTHEDLNTGKQTISAALGIALQDAFRELISQAALASVEWVITSLFADGAPRTEGLNTPVTDISVNTTVDSQRRRLPERGQ